MTDYTFKYISKMYHRVNINLLLAVLFLSNDILCWCHAANLKLKTNLDESANKKSSLPDKTYCGFQHSDDISTETSAALYNFPWTAILLYENKNSELTKARCTGSLINNRYVLTTATCVTIVRSKLAKVRLGEYNTKTEIDCITGECNDPPKDFNVEKKVAHPKYNQTSNQHDIALVRLSSSVEFTDTIRPICLPTPGSHVTNSGDLLTISGWGVANQNGDEAEIRKKIMVNLLSKEECIDKVEQYKQYLTEDQFCTLSLSNNTNYVCAGDSGAPVMFSVGKQWYQEGIVSFGVGCDGSKPDVHTKVINYLEWIKENLES